jgi:ZIP family zinc transporter
MLEGDAVVPHNGVVIAFVLTLVAGLSTGLGGLIALIVRQINARLLSTALGFSAGVMVYVSLVDIFDYAKDLLIENVGNRSGHLLAVAALFLGMLVAAIIDKLVPEYENPHSVQKIEQMERADSSGHCGANGRLLRMGVLSALAIAVHNFPEGIATFVASMKDVSLGIPIAVAVAIHNVPEGIAVAVPVYCATGERRKAFFYSFLSGLAEPAGALVGYLILLPLINDVVFGVIFAAVAGIMVFISFDELLPTAEEYGEHHLAMYGLLSGMAVMAISLVLFG